MPAECPNPHAVAAVVVVVDIKVICLFLVGLLWLLVVDCLFVCCFSIVDCRLSVCCLSFVIFVVFLLFWVWCLWLIVGCCSCQLLS